MFSVSEIRVFYISSLIPGQVSKIYFNELAVRATTIDFNCIFQYMLLFQDMCKKKN